MDEHKPQEQAPEKVPARRKSGRMHGWRASILACVICILVTALVTSMIFVGKFGGSSNYKLALKFAQVKQVVDKDYIGDADDTAISDASSSAIISAIGDKWSYYMTAEEYKAYQMYSNNEYAGIGVTIQLDDKTKGFRITAVTSDSPAAKAGWVMTSRRKARFVTRPSITKLSSAKVIFSIAAARVGAWTMSLASSASYRRPISSPRATPESTRIPSPSGSR